ncbi:DNA annealing helicase and endonuclease ZRANB3 isoform X3 [Rosa chinensis]|uniref:DNA annealing helicase and endonuclease ZRANB3 isoform X3 n=1 Tax=Rosa chinensis TaxID=74649 RepID=UPI000D097060|nr:DNA annealing helicase and endonuclease ZRANB3 isoform X3 [Rosa chinensis]
MEITEEQRKRAEANRLAALAKRKALAESSSLQQQHDPWSLFKCQKVSPDLNPSSIRCARDPRSEISRVSPVVENQMFRVRLEICSPDSFSATPVAVQGFKFPGREECVRRMSDCLAGVMPSHYTQNHSGGKAGVYKLSEYKEVLKCLRSNKGIDIEEIPWTTFHVVDRLSQSYITGKWVPCRPEHLLDDKVDELIGKLPKRLLDSLLPFQLEGVRFGLQRGGRCLIADEMGLGKTLQAIAIACCFMSEGSILVVCPAILRYSWAEELEHWLPFCLPADIHLVFGHENNPANLKKWPRVVVISYTMLHHLQKSMLDREWALLIVDESHHVRCTKKKSEPREIKAVLDVARKVKRIVLLSGTPSLSRPFDIFHQIDMLWPGLLGRDKFKFGETYCDAKYVRGVQGKVFQDFSKGTRLEELNMLLTRTVMIRRLKEHVLSQLPPKRRQIIQVVLKKSDIVSAKAAIRVGKSHDEDVSSEHLDELNDSMGCCISKQLSHQELGIAKLAGFREWLSIHPVIAEADGVAKLESDSSSHKMLIFAHHHKVLDGVQEFIIHKEIDFVRIDGNTLATDRQLAVRKFQLSSEVKIAIVGITAGGVGLDFSSATHVVFLELPQSPSLMLQAEDRAHRRGQTNAVNIYFFSGKDTIDESHWQYLNRSLRRVSSTTNGKYDAIQEIAVEDVSFFETLGGGDTCEDYTLQKSEGSEFSAELIKVPGSGCLAKAMKPFESNDKLVPNIPQRSERHHGTDGISSQTENSVIKDDVVSDLDMDNSISLDEKLETNVPETKIREGTVVYSCKLNKSSEDRDGLESLDKEDGIKSQTNKGHDGQSVQLIKGHDREPVQPIKGYDREPVQPIEAEEGGTNQVDALRFEVSQYTGRIHLYSCISGEDSRPRPLFENFRPEELESLSSSAAESTKGTVSNSFKDNPAYLHALLEFYKEWKKLRPIEQKKLIGKPLQLPLTVELCFLCEGTNHDNTGLLKGRSKRRSTPFDEISKPLPSNAVWKKVHLRSGYGKKEKQYTQGYTLTDEPLCKLCQTPCESPNAKEPEYFEDLFCNLDCYGEYRIRTSNRSIRHELFQLERGVCANCQLDCHKLVEHIRPLSDVNRRQYIEKFAPRVARLKKLLERLVKDPTEGNAWHADHLVPVYLGGGECRLENMRTLCVACHSDVTRAQCAERRSTRSKAKKQLKAIMSDLKNKGTEINPKDQGDPEAEENLSDDELLVKVPGSAYSLANRGDATTMNEDLEEPSNSEKIPRVEKFTYTPI